MSQDANQNYDNTPPSQQPSNQPLQNPYEQPATNYGSQNPYESAPPPQNPYEAPPPQNPYENPQSGVYGAQQPPPYGAQQPPPYGAPAGYGAPPPGTALAFSAGYQVPLTPLPLNEAVQQLPNQYIRVLTKPSNVTFAEELPKSSWDIVLVQLLIMIAVGVVFGIITSLFSSAIVNSYAGNGDVTGSSLQAFRSLTAATSIGSAFLRIITVPLFFFIGVGIQFLIAKAFRGEGTFLTQSYSTLLYQVPVYIINAVLSLLIIIPVAGSAIVSLIALALFIYSAVLNVYQIMATHRLSGGRATAVVLIPYAIAFLLVLLCGIAFGALLLAALHNVR